MAPDLYRRSIDIILTYQSANGAYIASPNFPTYHYSWYRDGAYIAYAMDLAGEHTSSARFHAWAAQVITQRAASIDRAEAAGKSGVPLKGSDILHTRYTLDGRESADQEWPNFQLDGFGTWLWAMREHLRLSQRPAPLEWLQAGALCARYLAALWSRPCYDCWEEYPDRVHPHTLAAVYGGLQAFSELGGLSYAQTTTEIAAFLKEQAAPRGYFVKSIGSHSVDASLLGLSTPYRVAEPDAPVMQATVQLIERTLHGGGVKRYATDTYYGGGEWVLLAGWLGWYYTECGQVEHARQLLAWIEAQADEQGCLPEQTPVNLVDPEYYQPWVEQWGEIARPLLWSHAMYIILKKKIG